MKKMISLIALLLAVFMLLSACTALAERNENTEDSTAGISNAVNTEESALPTEGQEENPVDLTADSTAGISNAVNTEESPLPTEGQEENPVDLTAIEEFRAIMKSNQWYGRAWDCTFEKPEEINALFFFYNGVGSSEPATGEELAFIIDAFKKRNPNTDNVNYAYNYKRLPVEKINEGLSVLGVTLEDIQIPDRWVYNEKTDAYYFWVSDAFGVIGVEVINVEKNEEGIMKAYWETERYHLNTATGEFMHGAKMVMTLQEQPDGTYRVLSNVPQE